MSATIGPTPQTEQVLLRLQAKKKAIPNRINAANKRIVSRTKGELNLLYGRKLAKKWTITISGGGALLSGITVATTAKEVYGYEFGTPPHMIYGKNSPRKLLRFYVGSLGLYGLVFTPRVSHPGTAGRSRRQSLQESFAFYCLDEWSSAMREAVINVT